MNSNDIARIIDALKEIQVHLRNEESKVDKNGLYDLIQRVLLAALGTALMLAFGLSKRQNTFKTGLEGFCGPSSEPPILFNNPRPLVSTALEKLS